MQSCARCGLHLGAPLAEGVDESGVSLATSINTQFQGLVKRWEKDGWSKERDKYSSNDIKFSYDNGTELSDGSPTKTLKYLDGMGWKYQSTECVRSYKDINFINRLYFVRLGADMRDIRASDRMAIEVFHVNKGSGGYKPISYVICLLQPLRDRINEAFRQIAAKDWDVTHYPTITKFSKMIDLSGYSFAELDYDKENPKNTFAKMENVGWTCKNDSEDWQARGGHYFYFLWDLQKHARDVKDEEKMTVRVEYEKRPSGGGYFMKSMYCWSGHTDKALDPHRGG